MPHLQPSFYFKIYGDNPILYHSNITSTYTLLYDSNEDPDNNPDDNIVGYESKQQALAVAQSLIEQTIHPSYHFNTYLIIPYPTKPPKVGKYK